MNVWMEVDELTERLDAGEHAGCRERNSTDSMFSPRIGGPFRAPEGTGLLTFRGLLIRDSESLGARFRGAEGTLKVPFRPRKFSLETESASARHGSSQTLARTGQ